MEKIIDDRSSGKTVRIICSAKEKGGTIVCKNVKHMVEKMYALGITGVPVISFDEFLSPDKDTSKPFYIDDVDCLLSHIAELSGGTVAAVAMSTDPVIKKDAPPHTCQQCKNAYYQYGVEFRCPKNDAGTCTEQTNFSQFELKEAGV